MKRKVFVGNNQYDLMNQINNHCMEQQLFISTIYFAPHDGTVITAIVDLNTVAEVLTEADYWDGDDSQLGD